MSDLFHGKVPDSFIRRVIEVLRAGTTSTFIVLTKRSRRAASLCRRLDWPVNVWLGVSIESNRYVSRADDLRETGAPKKVLSLEPLLGPVPDLDLTDIDWVIVGGQTAQRGAQPMEADWVRDVRDRCVAAGIPFFFKGWGGRNQDAGGRRLDGRTWSEYARGLRHVRASR